MLWIPLFWGMVLCHWIITFLGFKTILPQNARNQLPNDAVSHPGIMESPATPLQRPGVCSLSKVTLKISSIYIYYGMKYRMVYIDGWHTLCIQHFKCRYENILRSILPTAVLPFLIFWTLVERCIPAFQSGIIYTFQIRFITHLYLNGLSLHSLLMQALWQNIFFFL